MKQSPFENMLQRDLGPSRFSGGGFLGQDRRPVAEIIAEDMHFLSRHQIPVETLVQALTHAYDKAREALGAAVVIRPGVTATFYEAMGRVPSPFKGDGVFEKGETVVRDDPGNRTFIVTRLGIHLIEKYGFFQGRGSRYRIDPETVVETFGL